MIFLPKIHKHSPFMKEKKRTNKLIDAINKLTNIVPKDHKRQGKLNNCTEWKRLMGNKNYMQCEIQV